MYPAEFEYFAPRTVTKRCSCSIALGTDAKILAGGQSLLPMMKLRIASPRYLIDINRVEGLDGLRRDGRPARHRRAVPARRHRGIRDRPGASAAPA